MPGKKARGKILSPKDLDTIEAIMSAEKRRLDRLGRILGPEWVGKPDYRKVDEILDGAMRRKGRREKQRKLVRK